MSAVAPFSRSVSTTDTWLTPRDIISRLGPFDLDPCGAPEPRPWPTAARHYVEAQDGLSLPWAGRIWLNPPYGRETGKWLSRLASHGDGVALIFARVETRVFFDFVWPRAQAVLFPDRRISFLGPDGLPRSGPAHNASAPSCFVAYGDQNARALLLSGIAGAFIPLGTALITKPRAAA